MTGGNGLVITTLATAYTCGDWNNDGTVRTSPSSYPYTTGDVQWNTFSFMYGTLEYRAAYPASSTKLWPAHWMLGTNCQSANKYTGDTGTPGNPSILQRLGL